MKIGFISVPGVPRQGATKLFGEIQGAQKKLRNIPSFFYKLIYPLVKWRVDLVFHIVYSCKDIPSFFLNVSAVIFRNFKC